MKNKIQLVTTTSSIDGWEIENYLGIVSYHLVAGTNLFKDMFAGLRDFFGGYSASYQKELDKLEDLGLRKLKRKAEKLGANAIIGVRIDFDEISGGGKSMLMITISGTATKVNLNNSSHHEIQQSEFRGITKHEIKYKIIQEEMREDVLSDSVKISDIEDVNMLTKYQIHEALQLVTNSLYLPILDFDRNKENFIEYYKTIPNEFLNDFLKKKLVHIGEDSYSKLLIILKEIDWFDYDTIYFFLDCPGWKLRNKGLYLLKNEPQYYTSSDIEKLQIIVEKIDKAFSNFPKFELEKGMFGKEKEKWICPHCNSKVNVDEDKCVCSSDKYGFFDGNINPFSMKEGVMKRIKMLKSMETID